MYELKMMSIGGYSPQAMRVCHAEVMRCMRLTSKRAEVCAERAAANILLSWTKNLYRALDYIIYSDDKKCSVLNTSDGLMKLLCKIPGNSMLNFKA